MIIAHINDVPSWGEKQIFLCEIIELPSVLLGFNCYKHWPLFLLFLLSAGQGNPS